MERKIGEIFEFNGIIYKVIERANKHHYNCGTCDFYNLKNCWSILSIRGNCDSEHRLDKNDIFFYEVKE